MILFLGDLLGDSVAAATFNGASLFGDLLDSAAVATSDDAFLLGDLLGDSVAVATLTLLMTED
jgi:hypothetical protein